MNDHALYNKLPSNQIDLLEQLSDREFWEYAQSLAIQQHSSPVNGDEALECQTEQGHCLFPLWALREVVAPPYKLTRLPSSPPWMLGITVWRGHVIPVVDLTLYFVHQTGEPDTTRRMHPPASSRLLILDQANTLLALQLALVGSITTLEQAQLASSAEEAPAWYPRHLLPMLLEVYNGSVVFNLEMLVKQMIYQIHVGGAH